MPRAGSRDAEEEAVGDVAAFFPVASCAEFTPADEAGAVKSGSRSFPRRRSASRAASLSRDSAAAKTTGTTMLWPASSWPRFQ